MNASTEPTYHQVVAGEFPRPLDHEFGRNAELDEPRYLRGNVVAAADVSRRPNVIHLVPMDQPRCYIIIFEEQLKPACKHKQQMTLKTNFVIIRQYQ